MYPYFSLRHNYSKPVCAKETTPVLMPENTVNIKTVELIKAAIDDETANALFYGKLAQQLEAEDKDVAESIISDEAKHKKLLEYIYTLLTGENADETAVAEEIELSESTADNLSNAILDKAEAVKFYCELMLSAATDEVRDLFFEIMTDKGSHAALLNYLFTKYR